MRLCLMVHATEHHGLTPSVIIGAYGTENSRASEALYLVWETGLFWLTIWENTESHSFVSHIWLGPHASL